MRYRINEQVVLLCMPKEGPVGPLAPYLPSFARFLSQQGYTRYYLRRHLMLAARFSHWLQHRHIRSRCISSEHVRKYLRYRYRDRQANEGDSAVLGHLAAAVPIVACWSMASIPRAIAPEQTRKLLASIDRKTAHARAKRGGGGAIDLAVYLCGLSFVDAVKSLIQRQLARPARLPQRLQRPVPAPAGTSEPLRPGSRAEGTYDRLLKRHVKLSVLIIDDFALAAMSDREKQDLQVSVMARLCT